MLINPAPDRPRRKFVLPAGLLQQPAKVGLVVDNGRLVVDPQPRPRYTLDALLAQCNATTGLTDEDRAWLDDKPTGDDLL